MGNIEAVYCENSEADVSFSDNSLFNQDSTHFDRLLPGKILDQVRSKLGSSPDALASLTDSSPFFRNLLCSQRAQFLFENVFKILLKREGEKELPFSDVLKCREVCSLWNVVVDKQLKGKLIPAKVPETEVMGLPCYKTTNVFEASSEQVDKFVNHFEATHGKPEVVRSPFIWNNLTVITINNENGMIESDHEHLEALSSLLDKYGRFVKEFKLEILGGAFYLEDALKLQDWLAHMPNLKSLNIFDDTRSYEWKMSIGEFEGKMVATNFPSFTKLKHLKAVQFKQVRAPIFNRFIQQNHHISELVVTRYDDEYNFFTFPFRKLVSLDMNIDSVEMFEKLKRSAQIKWPMVEKLTIFFGPEGTVPCFIQLSEIFQVIQAKFGSELETLFLQLPKARNAKEAATHWMDSVNSRLDLPSLMDVKLTLRDPISLDFLLEMRHMLQHVLLEILYPIKRVKSNGTKLTVVQLNGFEKNIRASNIPKLFINLERIGISFGFGTKGVKWYCM